MKMVFHFIRVSDADITVDGSDISECVKKAVEQRMVQVTPVKIQGEVLPE